MVKKLKGNSKAYTKLMLNSFVLTKLWCRIILMRSTLVNAGDVGDYINTFQTNEIKKLTVMNCDM